MGVLRGLGCASGLAHDLPNRQLAAGWGSLPPAPEGGMGLSTGSYHHPSDSEARRRAICTARRTDTCASRVVHRSRGCWLTPIMYRAPSRHHSTVGQGSSSNPYTSRLTCSCPAALLLLACAPQVHRRGQVLLWPHRHTYRALLKPAFAPGDTAALQHCSTQQHCC
jgi:hypothetical protein